LAGGQRTASEAAKEDPDAPQPDPIGLLPSLPQAFEVETTEMAKDTFRVVTRGTDGTLHIRDYNKPEALQKMHTQIGIDDCSTDLGLRGQPVFRGLIGPMPEGKNVIRYESPEVFETLTKEWSTAKSSRAKGRAPQEMMSEPVEF
jgi:hypothetical protein